MTAASVASVSEARLPVEEELDELPVLLDVDVVPPEVWLLAARCRSAAGLAGRAFLHGQHRAAQIGIVAGRRQAAHARILRARSVRRRRLALAQLRPHVEVAGRVDHPGAQHVVVRRVIAAGGVLLSLALTSR